MSTPTILAGIVSWNTCAALRRCLRAIDEAAVPGLRTVVVDNASTDGSADMVAAEFPHVELVRSDINLGFAGGANRAFERGGFDYFLLLNPDVEIDAAALPRLVAFMETMPAAAAVAPLLTGTDGRVQTHMYRRFPTRLQIALFWTVLRPLTSRIGALRRRIFEHDLRGVDPVPVDQLPGAAMLIRAAALRSIGPFDAGYFVWWEDVDWCYRAMRAGYTLHVLPDARVVHEGGASFGAWSIETRVFQFYRAFYRFLAVHRLHALAHAAAPVIRADLRIKQLLLSVWQRSRGVGLGDARAAIDSALDDMTRGVVRDFDSAAPVHDEPPWLSAAALDADPVVDVVIVNWNGRRWLPRCIAALRRSTVPVNITVVDNASTDGSADLIAAEFVDVELIRTGRNAGYAEGANIGIAAGSARCVFVMNPDVIVDPDYLEALRDALASDARIGAAQGRLFALTPAEFDAGTLPRQTLDSAGHVIRRSRMVVDRGQGEADGPRYDAAASIFSACGAALLLRRAMLDDIAVGGEVFAAAFFAYKEDIDLGWRARLLGWDVLYVPDAVAHHVRAVPLGTAAWRGMSPFARRHSWKNHYLLMLRNDRVADLLRALPFVAGWELFRLGHALLRDPRVLGGWTDVVRLLPATLRARRIIMRRRRTPAAQMRRWFGADPVPAPIAGARPASQVAG
jgi:GT2 family glycosyltransferase